MFIHVSCRNPAPERCKRSGSCLQVCDGQFAIFPAQETPVGEAGTSASAPSSNEPPPVDLILNDAPMADSSLLAGPDALSLHSQISHLEGKIIELQRELRVQGHVARRTSADEDFMLSEINKAAEQLVCEYS